MKKLIAVLILLNSPLFAAEKFTRTQILMGNVPVSITIETTQKKLAEKITTRAFDEARRIEAKVSNFKPTSDTSRLNSHAGQGWVPIGHDLLKILMKAREISELTDGAFDITFLSKEPSDYSNVFLAPELSLAALRTQKTKIGVSGIAKGYIVDRISEILRKAGFKKFLVNAGDLYASGSWEIDIRNPTGSEEATLCTLRVHNQAVSTSGLYERGRHIMDPLTHRPVARLKSVTVIADSSIVADALGTGAFVMGQKKIPLLAERIPNVSILFVDHQGVRGAVGPGAVGKVSEDCLRRD